MTAEIPTEPEQSKVDSLDKAVRALVTLSLTAGFIWLAVMKDIDSGVFANTFGIVVTFWFVQRSAERAAAAAAKAASDATPSATVTGSAPSTITVTATPTEGGKP